GTDDGLFALSPDAASWTRLPVAFEGREAHPRVMDLITRAPGRIVAATSLGVLMSADGARTWSRPAHVSAGEVSALAASPINPDVVVAAARFGFFRTMDGGATWAEVAPPLPNVTPHAITFLPLDDNILLATSSAGLYRSPDQGATWQRVAGGIPHSDLT